MEVNPVRWFEIYVADMKRARAFYEGVFSTKLDPLHKPETIADDDMELWTFPSSMTAPGCSGALARMKGMVPNGDCPSTIIYFGSDDCAVEEARIAKHGGKVHKSKTSLGQYGFMVLALDTEGNVFGIHSMK